MTVTQSVIFRKDLYNTTRCRRWLLKHKLKPIKKAHETSSYYRYRIKEPDYDKYEYRIKRISDGIKMIIGSVPIDDNMEL